MTRVTHDLTVYDRWFVALRDGHKTYELREMHRDYQRGDVLHIRNLDDEAAPPLQFEVTHVLPGTGEYGLAVGWAVLSLRRLP